MVGWGKELCERVINPHSGWAGALRRGRAQTAPSWLTGGTGLSFHVPQGPRSASPDVLLCAGSWCCQSLARREPTPSVPRLLAPVVGALGKQPTTTLQL